VSGVRVRKADNLLKVMTKVPEFDPTALVVSEDTPLSMNDMVKYGDTRSPYSGSGFVRPEAFSYRLCFCLRGDEGCSSILLGRGVYGVAES